MTTSIHATLLISSRCPHCSSQLEILNQRVKSGRLASLEIINISVQPERAEQYGVRSVPWLRLQEYEFEGAQSATQIDHWLDLIDENNGQREYLAYQFQNNQLDKIIARVWQQPALLRTLLTLASDPLTDMKVQLGISAVMEELQATELLRRCIPELALLCQHNEARIRTQGAYYLSLTRDAQAEPCLRELLHDPDSEVRATAQEALSDLSAG